MNISQVVSEGLGEAARLRVDAAEVYVERTHLVQVRLSGHTVDFVKTCLFDGLNVRCIDRGRLGSSYQTPASREAVREAARRSAAGAAKTSLDPWHAFPGPNDLAVSTQTPDAAGVRHRALGKVQPARASAARALALAREAARAATAFGADAIDTVEFFSFQQEVAVGNSLGLARAYQHERSQLQMRVVAMDERTSPQTGTALGYSMDPSFLDVEPIAEEAVRRARAVRGASPIGSTEAPIILAPAVTASLAKLLASALDGENVHEGRSFFALSQLGRPVASPLVTLVDAPSRKGGPVCLGCDGEGVASGEKRLISGGVLAELLYNTYTARKRGVSTTGNGYRWSFKDAPAVFPANIYLEPGATADLESSTPTYLYVQEVQGLHSTNRVTGHFSLGVTGYWSHQGSRRPVRGVSIAGDLPELLRRVDAVGSDTRFFPGSWPGPYCAGAPAVRLSSLVISGV